MAGQIVKNPGPDWDVHYMYLDGQRDCMSVFGCRTPEEAIAEAGYSLNVLCESEAEKDRFEILVVIRLGAGIDVTSG
jgi:hypothetical protein